MANPKNRWLIILLCVNVLLITMLVMNHVGLPKAYAQFQANDYIMLPSKIQSDREVIWVIDLGSNKITNCQYNDRTRRIEFGNVIDMPDITMK